jgi:large subunit ribosomal protein L2
MGKRIIQQKRGKGSPSYKSPSFRFKGKAGIEEKETYTVLELLHDPGRSAPVARVEYDDGDQGVVIAPEGIKEGETFTIGADEIERGNVMQLSDIPVGTSVFNIESQPGDKGKFVRSGGTTARVVGKTDDKVMVRLPSKTVKEFNPNCRATIGVVAGGGRTEKPFMKAGNKWKARKARNKLYPKVSGVAMNSLSHPFGGTKSSHKGRPTIAPKNAPPGRKVGKVRPRQTGRSKGRKRERGD